MRSAIGVLGATTEAAEQRQPQLRALTRRWTDATEEISRLLAVILQQVQQVGHGGSCRRRRGGGG